MTPHDSTRCACGHGKWDHHTFGQCRVKDCECEDFKRVATPTEPVGAVDALTEVLEYITGLDREPESAAVVLSLRELRLLREQVATLTADKARLEARVGRLQESVNKMSGWADDERNPLARATPAEGSELFPEPDFAPKGTIPATIRTTPPRSPQDIARALLGEGWLADSLDTPEKLRDYFVEYGRQSAPPRSPATVTEAMVEAAYLAWAGYQITQTDISGYGAMRDAIAAALSVGGRDAE